MTIIDQTLTLTHLQFGLTEALSLVGDERKDALQNVAEEAVAALERAGSEAGPHLRLYMTESLSLGADEAVYAFEAVAEAAVSALEAAQ